MIFYGDSSRRTGTADAWRGFCENTRRTLAEPPGLARHGGLVGALIGCGEIAQGVADAGMAVLGADGPFPAERQVMIVLRALAGLVGRSWDSGFAQDLAEGARKLCRTFEALDLRVLPEEIEIRRPEGYAHYALYPEGYWQAARPLGPRPDACVIGIRSVGTSLGAIVAAALGAGTPVTVRPTGPPFARRIEPSPALESALGGAACALWAIVDEGPGLSGSSFGAVADACEGRGVRAERMVFFPSHDQPPGSYATEGRRLHWARGRRSVVSFETLLLRPADRQRGLETWFADITGPPSAPMDDIAGGRWRGRRSGLAGAPPPADLQNERRKYLLHAADGTFLLKFTGLGSCGEEKLARAQALAAANFSPSPLALRHGFLLERWRDDVKPLSLEKDRGAFLDHLARYLGFRARSFPAEASDGASLEALWAMAQQNLAEAIGDAAGRALVRWLARGPSLAGTMHRVFTDNRLPAWEWLVAPDGTVLKSDALDHCVGHDLIGCQDIAWDVAGAVVEFALSRGETEALRKTVGREGGRACDPDLVRAFRIAYSAFQLGAWSMARERDGEQRGGEQSAILDRTVERYRRCALSAIEDAGA